MANIMDLRTVVKHLVDGNLDEKLCRICLLPLGDICENIFTKICKADSEYCIADVLEKVFNTKFSETDNYQVCPECFIAASTAYKLYLQLQRSNEILNFYVDELHKNVAYIETPDNVVNDSLCITLQDYIPKVDNFDHDVEHSVSNKFEIGFDDTVVGAAKSKLKKIQGPKVKIEQDILNKKFTDDDEDVVIVIKENGEPSFYKIKDGILEFLNKDERKKTKVKVRRKRVPLPYRKCSRCDVRYRFIAKLKEHMKLVHNVDFFICKVCNATTENEDEFNNHLKTHTNFHRCAICNTIFKKRDTIIAHLKWHEDTKNLSQTDGAHVCELCGIILPNEDELKEHYSKKHDKKYTCFYCGKLYRAALSFEMHLKKHEMHMNPEQKRKYAGKRSSEDIKPKQPVTKDKKLMCSICGRDFVDERALKWHTMLHNNDRPFNCDVCGRGFVTVNRRNQHAVCAHTVPTRRCPLCPALFHLRSMVNTHIKKVHLKAHKRRNRTSKHQNVFWRTEPVPIQELSVSIQNEILELKTASGQQSPDDLTTFYGTSPLRSRLSGTKM